MTAQIREPAARVAARARWMLWAMAWGWRVARLGPVSYNHLTLPPQAWVWNSVGAA